METDLTLGEKIRNYRRRAGFSQMDLETEIGASPGSISRIENGQNNPTKETLIRVIDALNLSPREAASLFNLNIYPEMDTIVDFGSLLNLEDIDSILNSVVDKIKKVFNTHPVSLWLWDEGKQALSLKNLIIPNDIKIFAEQLIGFKSEQLIFYKNDPKFSLNDYLRTMLEGKIIETKELYFLSYPYISRKLTQVIEKWLKFKLVVSLPLIFNNTKVGVLSVMWNADYITHEEKLILQAYASQIAIVIYNAQKYEELNKKYLKLKNRSL